MTFDYNIKRMEKFINHHLGGLKNGDGVPPFSSIEFSINGACNRRCKFCPRIDADSFPNDRNSISLELLKKIIDELVEHGFVGRISYSGFCEPLLTENLEEYIAYARKRSPELTIEMVTNGDLLTKARMETLFEAGLNNIRVSLYDGPEQVMVRNRYLDASESYGLTINNRGGTLKLEDGDLSVVPLNEPLQQPCYFPFYKMLINYDGNVVVCSNDWLQCYVVGNIAQKTVYEVWKSDEFNQLRKKLIESNRHIGPCEKCDVNGTYNGEQHFKVWKEYYAKQHV